MTSIIKSDVSYFSHQLGYASPSARDAEILIEAPFGRAREEKTASAMTSVMEQILYVRI